MAKYPFIHRPSRRSKTPTGTGAAGGSSKSSTPQFAALDSHGEPPAPNRCGGIGKDHAGWNNCPAVERRDKDSANAAHGHGDRRDKSHQENQIGRE